MYFCHLCSIKFTYTAFVKNHHVAQCLKQWVRWKLRFCLSMWLETGHVCNMLNVEKKIIHRCLCAMEPIFNSVLHLECQDIKNYNYCMFYHLRRRSHGRSKNVKETNSELMQLQINCGPLPHLKAQLLNCNQGSNTWKHE